MVNMRQHDFLVFIGRFQPFHIGHKAIIDRALERATTVVVLVGSANVAPSIKNPFTFEERLAMLKKVFHYEITQQRIIVLPVGDHPSDDRWAADVRKQVRKAVGPSPQVDLSVALTGFEKDASSTYLRWFPEWALDFPAEQVKGLFNATDIRQSFFQGVPRLPDFVCPPEVNEWLKFYAGKPPFWRLVEEKKAIDDYHKLWSQAPFPPHFVTGDAVVEQNKKVLLIRRSDAPGKDLLALPGGFLDVKKDKSVRDTSIRELREETKIADNRGEIPHGRLGDFIRDYKVFDAPDRDPRGRIVTHAHYFNLPDGDQYAVKGSDDAYGAAWHTIGPTLDPREFYADHYHILTHFFGL